MTTTDVLFAPEKLPDGDIRDHIRLDNNGFVVANVGDQDRLLFWIPAHLRKDHLLPRRHLLMQLGSPVELDLSTFVHGTGWASCYALMPPH